MSVFPVVPAVPNPGININLGPRTLGDISSRTPGFDFLPNSAVSANSLASRLSYGNPPMENSSIFFEANTNITHSYVVTPFGDHSELFIEPLQLVFANRYVDKRNQTTNVVSVFKLVQIMREKHAKFLERAAIGGTREATFQAFLNTNGEAVLREYDMLKNSRDPSAAEVARKLEAKFPGLADAHKMTSHDDCRYASLCGILKEWNFLGVVSTTGESTGNGSYMDGHVHSSMIKSVAVIEGLKARVANVFSGERRELQVGSKVFLVIRRAYGRRNEPFQVEAVCTYSRACPEDREYFYTAHNGEETPGHVICVGTVTERSGISADTQQQAVALGIGASTLEQAKDATANLPTLYIQLGL